MEFNDFFKNQIDNPPPIGLIMKFNSLRIDKEINRLIFVEGSSDSRFYSATNIDELTNSAYYIFQTYREGNGGKEAVYYAFKEIKSNPELRVDLERCIFIVDRDWELSIKSKDGLISSKDRDMFTLTQGHSMECYFLEKENLEVIFSELEIHDHLNTFIELLDDFREKSYHFWALKGTLQYADKHGIRIYYRKKYSWEDIFDFDFKKSDYFRIERMNEEISLMQNALKSNNDLMNYCKKWDEKIENESRFIRGHDCFNFLICYIDQICGCKISERVLYSFVPKFFVVMDIKCS